MTCGCLHQVDCKFVVLLLGRSGMLAAMDQHAADERVRLEALQVSSGSCWRLDRPDLQALVHCQRRHLRHAAGGRSISCNTLAHAHGFADVVAGLIWSGTSRTYMFVRNLALRVWMSRCRMHCCTRTAAREQSAALSCSRRSAWRCAHWRPNCWHTSRLTSPGPALCRQLLLRGSSSPQDCALCCKTLSYDFSSTLMHFMRSTACHHTCTQSQHLKTDLWALQLGLGDADAAW